MPESCGSRPGALLRGLGISGFLNRLVLFCTAACKGTNDSFTINPHPTWGREQKPGTVSPLRAFFMSGATIDAGTRSEERRVGKEGVSTCRYRWSPYH